MVVVEMFGRSCGVGVLRLRHFGRFLRGEDFGGSEGGGSGEDVA